MLHNLTINIFVGGQNNPFGRLKNNYSKAYLTSTVSICPKALLITPITIQINVLANIQLAHSLDQYS